MKSLLDVVTWMVLASAAVSVQKAGGPASFPCGRSAEGMSTAGPLVLGGITYGFFRDPLSKMLRT